jgi:hypothetical protein
MAAILLLSIAAIGCDPQHGIRVSTQLPRALGDQCLFDAALDLVGEKAVHRQDSERFDVLIPLQGNESVAVNVIQSSDRRNVAIWGFWFSKKPDADFESMQNAEERLLGRILPACGLDLAEVSVTCMRVDGRSNKTIDCFR